MNKTELINCIAKDAGISKAAAEAAINSLTSNITNSLKKGEKVSLMGWGTWSSSVRAIRTVNSENDSNKITSKRVIKFRPSSKFKDEINS